MTTLEDLYREMETAGAPPPAPPAAGPAGAAGELPGALKLATACDQAATRARVVGVENETVAGLAGLLQQAGQELRKLAARVQAHQKRAEVEQLVQNMITGGMLDPVDRAEAIRKLIGEPPEKLAALREAVQMQSPEAEGLSPFRRAPQRPPCTGESDSSTAPRKTCR